MFNIAQYPILQEIQKKDSNAEDDNNKTTSPQREGATLTNRQVETSHQAVRRPAPCLYLILPEPVTETNLCSQFEQYRPIKSVQMIENAGPSNNKGILKWPPSITQNSAMTPNPLWNARSHTNPGTAFTTAAPTAQKKWKPRQRKRRHP